MFDAYINFTVWRQMVANNTGNHDTSTRPPPTPVGGKSSRNTIYSQHAVPELHANKADFYSISESTSEAHAYP
jgi:hypothetical protein